MTWRFNNFEGANERVRMRQSFDASVPKNFPVKPEVESVTAPEIISSGKSYFILDGFML